MVKPADTDLTAGRLRQLLYYDRETGVFRWRARSGQERTTLSWNGRYAGKVAGYIANFGYRLISVENRHYLASRLAWLYEYGEWPNYEIDHINGNPLDDMIENLRVASRSENVSNTGLRSDNTSGVKGVNFHKQKGKWRARITKDGKEISLGLFDSIEEAKNARLIAAREIHGVFARFAA